MCVVNMNFPGDIFVWKIFKHICDIQIIYTFKRAWETFDIHTIVIANYEHSFLVHDTISVNIKCHEDLLVQQVF
jgi:hypothetical protein